MFPWTMSDFSLMDAIECGIVKLPRVPVADNVPGGDTPKFRNLWEEIKKSPRGLPKKGRSAGAKSYDPLALPTVLLSALDALYGHYEKTFELWDSAKVGVPPVFIVVCNNTSTSELDFGRFRQRGRGHFPCAARYGAEFRYCLGAAVTRKKSDGARFRGARRRWRR